jgi:hypothetical protein
MRCGKTEKKEKAYHRDSRGAAEFTEKRKARVPTLKTPSGRRAFPAKRRGTVTQRSQRTEHRGHREEGKKQIPPLRGPTRHKSARKNTSGPALRDRDDNVGRDYLATGLSGDEII